VGECGPDSSGSGSRQMAGCCENGNEPSGSVKWLSDHQLLKEDSL
jgi:hypothetical protein